MASIFNALHIGYSGLNASQLGIDTTGHNIANAETEGYTRQRLVQSAATPVSIQPGERGNGVEVDRIVRVFDSFVYDRYTKTAQEKSESDYIRQTLETLSTYFPEVDNVGVKADLQSYFDLWQSLSDNPDNSAVRVALAQQAETLTDTLSFTRDQVFTLQSELNDELKVAVDEVNRIGKEIAQLNRSIADAELADLNQANDLRDQRNRLELALGELIGADVFSGEIASDRIADRNVKERQDNYNVHIGGFNIVDGTSFHPLVIDNTNNPEGFFDLFYERQDGEDIPFPFEISGGEVGAILELRGSTLDETSGIPVDGTLQSVLDQLDAFAGALITSTNNLYAAGATTHMESNPTDLTATDPVVRSGLNIQEGSFDLVLYDVDGNETARRTITIDSSTAMDDGTPGSIVGQLTAIIDDNNDGSLNNDIDSLIQVQFLPDGRLVLDVSNPSSGFTFGVEDDTSNGLAAGTNFAGAIGLQRFFDGTNAKNIGLNSQIRENPTLIHANKQPQEGNNTLALDMIQLQFEDVTFRYGGSEVRDELYAFYDTTVTYVGSTTNAAIITNDSLTAQYIAIEQEYTSISQVSIDEELTNLIKYQTAYGAAAKIITTIDQMMDTLLGIKR